MGQFWSEVGWQLLVVGSGLDIVGGGGEGAGGPSRWMGPVAEGTCHGTTITACIACTDQLAKYTMVIWTILEWLDSFKTV